MIFSILYIAGFFYLLFFLPSFPSKYPSRALLLCQHDSAKQPPEGQKKLDSPVAPLKLLHDTRIARHLFSLERHWRP